MNRLLGLPIIGTLLFLPFFYLESTIDPVVVPRFLFVSMVLLVIYVAVLFQLSRNHCQLDFSFVRRAIIPAMIGYIVICAISLFQALNIAEGIFDLLKILVSILFFLVVTSLIVTDSRYYLLLSKTMVVVGIGLSVIGIGQYHNIFFDRIPGNVIPYGTMANKNLLASSIFLVMPLIFYVWYRSRALWKWIAGISNLLVLYLIIVSQTRAVWMAIAVSTAITSILLVSSGLRLMRHDKFKPAYRHRNIAIIIALSIILLAIPVVAVYHLGDLPDKWDSLSIFRDHSLNVRLGLWEKSLRMFGNSPLIGCGLGNWKIIIPQYGIIGRISPTENVFFLRPHNDFIWVLAETGPLGLILYLSVFYLALYYAYRLLIREPVKENRVLYLSMIFGVIGFLVVSFFSYPRERIVHPLLISINLSIIVSSYHRLFSAKRPISKRIMMAGIIASILCLMAGIVVGFHRLNAEIHTKKAVAAASRQAWKTTIDEIDRAQSSFVDLDPTTTPLAYYKGFAYFSLNDINTAFESFKEAYLDNPYHIQVLNNLASCYEVKGDHTSAIEYYEKALVVSPYLEQTLVNLAAVYYNMGRYEEAYSVITQKRSGPKDPRYDQFLKRISDKLNEDNGL